MKPVLIQHLLKKNKGKYKAAPMSDDEKDHYDNKFGSVVLWFVAVLVLVSLFLG